MRGGPPGPGGEPKAPKSRAERRAEQEHQRAVKAAKNAGGAFPPAAPQGVKAAASAGSESSKLAPKLSLDPAAKAGKVAAADSAPLGGNDGGAGPGGAASTRPTPAVGARKGTTKVVSLASTEMFAHLQQYKKVSVPTLLTHKDAQSIHPAVLQLGLRYADGSISGANARCVAMMHTLCQVKVKDCCGVRLVCF